MKRLLISAIALLLVFSVQTTAQTRFGITAGMNFNTSKIIEHDVDTKAGWHAGVTCLFDLPAGFSIQPSLIYNQRGANLTRSTSQEMGYIELPVSVQWGPDLIFLRPFIDVTPYVGYAVANKFNSEDVFAELIPESSWEGKQRLEYGLGIGGGLNIWKLQILARYCWNFGSLYNENWEGFKNNISNLKIEDENFGGVTLSIAFFF